MNGTTISITISNLALRDLEELAAACGKTPAEIAGAFVESAAFDLCDQPAELAKTFAGA